MSDSNAVPVYASHDLCNRCPYRVNKTTTLQKRLRHEIDKLLLIPRDDERAIQALLDVVSAHCQLHGILLLSHSYDGWRTLTGTGMTRLLADQLSSVDADPLCWYAENSTPSHQYDSLFKEKYSHVISIPLNHAGRMIGLLFLASTESSPCLRTMGEELNILVHLLTYILVNHHTKETAQRVQSILHTTLDIDSRSISTQFDEILHQIVNDATSAVAMDAGALFLLDEAEHRLNVAAAHNLPPTHVPKIAFDQAEGVPGWVLSHREHLIVPDALHDVRVHPQVVASGIRSVLCVPLLVNDLSVGTLNFFATLPNAFDSRHAHMARLYADRTAMTIYNSRQTYNLSCKIVALQEEVDTCNAALSSARGQMMHADAQIAAGRIAASVAHEINNPLQSMLFYLKLLTENVNDKALPQVEILKQEAAQIAHIARQMLNLTRVADIKIAPCDLHDLLNDILCLLDLQIRRAGCTVTLTADPDLPPIPVDAGQIKQIIINLLLNALDAMPNGGAIAIRLRRTASHISIEVADEGDGISADLMDRLFEPFFSTKASGSGLGLSVCQEIVKAHGGEISVASREERGSVFAVLLPVSPTNDVHFQSINS